jgi:hypothetical protein
MDTLNIGYSASEDIPQASIVRRLLKDLREIRQAKVRSGLAFINGQHLIVSQYGILVG